MLWNRTEDEDGIVWRWKGQRDGNVGQVLADVYAKRLSGQIGMLFQIGGGNRCGMRKFVDYALPGGIWYVQVSVGQSSGMR